MTVEKANLAHPSIICPVCLVNVKPTMRPLCTQCAQNQLRIQIAEIARVRAARLKLLTGAYLSPKPRYHARDSGLPRGKRYEIGYVSTSGIRVVEVIYD